MALQKRAQKKAAHGLSRVPDNQAGMTLAQLRATVTPTEIAECLQEALKASTILATKDGDTIETPNWNARLQAVTILLNYFEGRPIERQEILTKDVTEDDGAVMARILKSPAARKELRKLLDAAEAG